MDNRLYTEWDKHNAYTDGFNEGFEEGRSGYQNYAKEIVNRLIFDLTTMSWSKFDTPQELKTIAEEKLKKLIEEYPE